MGNACYVDNHYSSVIQTREYRSPEVIMRGEYDETADMWSLACMVFELVTGDYMFDPKKGKTYKKNDDHLALIEELIGPYKDLKWLKSNENWKNFYNSEGRLKRIQKLKPWRLQKVLEEKYMMKPIEAYLLARFLDRMIKWNPRDRPQAHEMLDDPWLKLQDDWDPFVSRRHQREIKKATDPEYTYSETTPSDDEESEESSSGGSSANV
jgi:serine/threonine-protein kinase SRPK3